MRILGIRHHGPGSARNAIQVLAQVSPDALFIELPLDIEKYLTDFSDTHIRLPIALLSFNQDKPKNHFYFPFAEFSPEWQVIQFAHKNKIPIHCIDIPTSLFSAFRNEDTPTSYPRHNPLFTFAKLAGYDDIESWWESTFEMYEQPEVVFDIILSLMREFREHMGEIDEETKVREAFMRQQITSRYKEYRNSCVICGAFHTAALEDLSPSVAKADKHLLRNIPKTKNNKIWMIPWSYRRMSKTIGYHSGVIAPAWYESIWHADSEVHFEWLGRATQLLRKEGVLVSTAHLIDASNLLQQLLHIRERRFPSIYDILDVILTSLCNGNQKTFEKIKEELLIGDKIGSVPEAIGSHPIIADFFQSIRTARLTKVIKEEILYVKKLDLRKKMHLETSRFFYRLLILDIDFSHLVLEHENSKGSFGESWEMKWYDELRIEIIKAGLYGHTILDACEGYLQVTLQSTSSIQSLVQLLFYALKGYLSSYNEIIKVIHQQATDSDDLCEIMQLTIDLIPILQLGTVHAWKTEAIREILNYSFQKTIVHLSQIYQGIDHDVAIHEKKRFLQFRSVLYLYGNTSYIEMWKEALTQMYQAPLIHILYRGLATRMLFDKQVIPSDKIIPLLQRHMHQPYSPLESALWLEGLLSGSGYRLLRNNKMLYTLDIWLRSLSPEDFMGLLPVLRRTFAEMNSDERRKLFDRIHEHHNGTNDLSNNQSARQLVSENIQINSKALPPIYQQLLGNFIST